MRNWLTSLPARIAEAVIGGLVLLLVVDHFSDRVNLHVRTWLFGLVILVALGVVVAATWRLARRRAQPPPEALDALRQQVADLELETGRRAEYAEHLRQILDHLQQVIAGRMPGVDYLAFIERGILEPARDMLREDQSEDVRLSVLAPTEDNKSFRMAFAAGHSLPSKTNYSLEVDESISRFALLKGKPYVWHDLEKEPAYKPHPKATRAYRSMVSLPIRADDTIWGVFNVISTEANSFQDVDIEYIKFLGSIINVATSLILASRNPTTDTT
jgi:GAF domain-containing protein